VISGEEAEGADYNVWFGFEAAHIFPLAYERHWLDHNYDRWISLSPENGKKINSVQNGLLLKSDIHQLFDSYAFSINPDVCLLYIPYEVIITDNYLRIIIRLYSSRSVGKTSPASISINNFLITLNDPLMSFYVGISGRLS
jgi:hypothetical protein